jgi:choloylglycine hydrolase
MVTEQSGKSIVVEYLRGELTVFDNGLRVLTNSPSFDWHVTNLRNYVNLSATALPTKKIENLEFGPIGAGSGLLGLPGDYTPPSRFIRAVAYTQTARKTPDGPEAVYEAFRILDNFNLPLGAAEGPDTKPEQLKGMRSATIWSSVADAKNLVYYYHTQHNRKIRFIDLKRIDFSPTPAGIQRFPLDKKKSQELVSCVGCHSGIGATTDSNFSFARKLPDSGRDYSFLDAIREAKSSEKSASPEIGKFLDEYPTFRITAPGTLFVAPALV